MSEQDIDLSEIPEITEEQMRRATRRVGGEPVAQDKGRGGTRPDSDVTALADTQAG